MTSAKNVDIRAEPTSLLHFTSLFGLALMRAFLIALDITEGGVAYSLLSLSPPISRPAFGPSLHDKEV